MSLDTQAVVALREPKMVPLNQVDHELNRIWATQTDGSATRASTFNLVVWSGNSGGLAEVIGAIAVQYPCRTLVIQEDADAAEMITAEVTAYCPLGSGGQRASVCCEYVTLHTRPNTLGEVSAAILALLIPDLPTYLWWHGGMPLSNPLFQDLRGIAEFVILDSATDPTFCTFSLLDRLAQKTIVGDLAWGRIREWRELTAKAFDDNKRRMDLGQISRVELEYVAGDTTQAWFFIGWLASCLNWQNPQIQPEGAVFQGPSGAVETVWQSVSNDRQPGNLVSIKINFGSEKDLLIRSGLIADCAQVELDEGGQCTFEQTEVLQDLTLAQLLAQELQHVNQTDPLYQAALGLLLSLIKD